jgi:hypothetical protein
MATSGTVATTTLDTAVVIEHAMRRVGIQSSLQTPESVEIAKQNLYLLLLNLANRGLNLWCVEKNIIPLVESQAKYDLLNGTVRLLNVLYSQVTRATGTDTVAADSVTTELSTAVQGVRWGFKLGAAVTGAIALETSADGVTWATAQSIASAAWTTDFNWYELDPPPTALWWRVTCSVPATFDEFYIASSVRDWPMNQFNRDEYAQQPNKQYEGTICTNYFYDKTVAPTITVWPVPSNGYDQLSVWRHRFVQDIGTLTQQIEVPQMWMESIIWQLAVRLAFELDGVTPDRQQSAVNMSERYLMDAELGESDNAPIYLVPGVGVYTR